MMWMYIVDIICLNKCQFFKMDWPTNMERFLLYAKLLVNGLPTVVGTVHLESLENESVRKKQLDMTYKEFENYKIAFIMGDFNFVEEPIDRSPIHSDDYRIKDQFEIIKKKLFSFVKNLLNLGLQKFYIAY